MTESGSQTQFYGELAPWWPLLSPLEDYEEEAAQMAVLLRGAQGGTRRVLELGSGGGHNAAHLKSEFELTLVDLSEAMLEVSRALNPECRHVCADMRSLALGESFDAVFVHDAIDHLTTVDDLAALFRTAFEHCRPGGIAVFLPDHTAERFEAGTAHGGSDGADGRGARYLEWTWDPDPDDHTVVTDYVFVLRDQGEIRHVHEQHVFGLFPRATWVRSIEDAGFVVEVRDEVTDEDRTPREIFIARRP